MDEIGRARALLEECLKVLTRHEIQYAEGDIGSICGGCASCQSEFEPVTDEHRPGCPFEKCVNDVEAFLKGA